MRKWLVVAAVMMWVGGPVLAQAQRAEPIEVPLRVEEGRLLVTLDGPDGAKYDFVLGLGMMLITESGAANIGDAMSSLTLGGLSVATDQATTVPDALFADAQRAPTGVLGGLALNRYDILIDAPNERLVLKPAGRSVRWDGVSLSNGVSMTVFHDVLARVDVEVGGELFGGLLDLMVPEMQVNAPIQVAAGLSGDRMDSFRMGYAAWPDLPVAVTDSPIFQGWDPQGNGFVIVGASIAYDCAIAISWVHSELRTCVR